MDNLREESAKMCLDVITPINIGTGTTLGAKEYLYDPKKQQVYFLNLPAWHKFIYEKHLLRAYEEYIDRRKKDNLLSWLKNMGYTIEDVKDCLIGSALAEVNTRDATQKQTLNDILTQMKHPDGTMYIPGSSIKGIFRTAILYNQLQKNAPVKSRYWNRVKDKISSPKFKPRDKEIKKITTDLEADLLHKTQLSETPFDNANAVLSTLRGLQVSDTYDSDNLNAAVLQKIDVGFDKRTGKVSPHAISVFRECILPGGKLYFDVKLDKTFTRLVGVNSINDLLTQTQQFFNAVLSLLNTAFGNYYPDPFQDTDRANMFVGSNTGFLSKTLLAFLAPTPVEAKETIKILLDKSFRNHKHILHDKVISPRTLKVTSYQGRYLLMGLGRVSKL